MMKDKYQEQFREQLLVKDNVYNIMALCISYIMIKGQMDFRKFKSDDFEAEKECVDEYQADRSAFGEATALFNFKENLKEIFKDEVDVIHCYAIVYFLDKNIPPKKPCRFVNEKIFVEYTSLNSELTDKVRILPYYKETKYENAINKIVGGNMVFRERREYAISPIGKFLSQYIIFDENAIEIYPLKMYYIPKETGLSEKLCSKPSISIKIFPLLNKELKEVLDYDCKLNLFYINGFHESAKNLLRRRNELIRQEIELDTNIDFYILPEMLSDAKMDSYMSEINNRNNVFFVINGSKWENNENISKILFFCKNDKKEFEYYKKSCFKLKEENKTYVEGIKLEKTNYLVWDIEGFGRVSICVCCDLIQEEIKQFHMLMRTNLLFVPSYTGSMDLLSGAEALSKDYKSIVVVANSCSAVALKKEDDRVCFVTLPGKKSTDREVKKYFIRRKECWKNCSDSKCGIVLNINLDEYCIDEDNISSFKIIET